MNCRKILRSRFARLQLRHPHWTCCLQFESGDFCYTLKSGTLDWLKSAAPSRGEGVTRARAWLSHKHCITIEMAGPGVTRGYCRFWCSQTCQAVLRHWKDRDRRVIEQLAQNGREQRRYISNLLHQGVCQKMTASNLLLGLVASSMLESGPLSEDFEQARDQLQSACLDLRHIFDKHLQHQTQGDLATRLRRLVFSQPALVVELPPTLPSPGAAAEGVLIELLYYWQIQRGATRPWIRYHGESSGEVGLRCGADDLQALCDPPGQAWLAACRLAGIKARMGAEHIHLSWPARPAGGVSEAREGALSGYK